MADTHTPEQRSKNMAACRRRDTGAEIALRRALHARGLRYRVDVPVRVGSCRARPDVVFTRARVAVYVHGCFWHGCPDGHRGTPKTNAAFWGPKIQRTRERDAAQVRALRDANWNVLVFWEHDDPETAADLVVAAVCDRPRPQELES